jgi:UDP:flavonoid glycosyltransferase YjiC (YdhE family)
MSGRTDPPTACIAFAAASLDDHASTPAAWRYVGLSPYHPPQRWWSEEDPPERDTVLVTWGSGRVGGERELLGQLIPVLIELSHDLRIVVQSADSEVREMVEVQFSGEGRVETQTPNRDPQYDLYRRARLVIGHGGYGTINEALAFGAPVLVLPELVADRMETARRVHRAGVGASLNRYTATTSSLRTTVHRILAEPAIQCAVEHVGADLRDRSPSEQVLDQLRTFLR